jgi:F0F1-type ATP synthase assembly protein I
MDENEKIQDDIEKIDEADLNDWFNEWPTRPDGHTIEPTNAASVEQDTSDSWPANKDAAGNDALGTPAETAFAPIEYSPISQDETIRRSGLAWSAGIVFFSSIAFTLFLGWLADLLLGSSPWGLVGGIVLGSIIGFVQFFRITSQIFGSDSSKPAIKSLLSDDDDDV